MRRRTDRADQYTALARRKAGGRVSRYWAVIVSYWTWLVIPGAIGFGLTLPIVGAHGLIKEMNGVSLLLLIVGLYLMCWTPGVRAVLFRLINPDPVPRVTTSVMPSTWPAWSRRTYVLVGLAALLIGLATVFGVGPADLRYVLLVIALTAVIGGAVLWLKAELLKLHIPLLFAAIYFLLLKSPQGIEAIRTINETWWGPRIGLYLLWLFGCSMFSLMLGSLGLNALGLREKKPFLLQQKLALSFLVIAPFAAAAIAVWWASEQSIGGTVSHQIDLVIVFWVLSVLFCGVVFSILADGESDEELGAILLANTSIFAAAALLPVVFVEMPPALFVPAWIGMTALVFFMVGNAGREVRLPAIFLLIVWGGLLSTFDLNDNHELTVAHKPALAPDLADEAFSKWLARVKEPQPVTAFVAVSEGGGARAAYMTAVALEALRTRCAAFRRQHFATIAVSGGSLGATLTAIAPEPQTPAEDCKTLDGFDVGTSKAVAAAGLNLLGPVLRGLSVDLLMRFWPSSLWRTDGLGPPNDVQRPWVSFLGDRTQYMERSLAAFWDHWGQSSVIDWPLRSNSLETTLFSDAWPGPGGNSPALILMTTDVGSGRRVAISHVRFGPLGTQTCLSQRHASTQPAAERARLLTLAEIAPQRDPTVLGAALTSARFPLVTPAATLPCAGVPWRLVDGGYFENSGLTTALDLVDELAKGSVSHNKRVGETTWAATDLRRKPVQVVLIRIENSDAAPPPQDTSAWFPELFSPLRAVGGTRDARADLARVAVERAERRGVYGPDCASKDGACVQLKQHQLKLAHCETQIPLGWSLSEGAKTDIRRQLGLESLDTASACVRNAATANQQTLLEVMRLAAASPR